MFDFNLDFDEIYKLNWIFDNWISIWILNSPLKFNGRIQSGIDDS